MRWLMILGSLVLIAVLFGIYQYILFVREEKRRIKERRAERQRRHQETKFFDQVVDEVVANFDFDKHWNLELFEQFQRKAESCSNPVEGSKDRFVFDPGKVIVVVRDWFNIPYRNDAEMWEDSSLSTNLDTVHGELFGFNEKFDPRDPGKWVRKALESHPSSLVLLPSSDESESLGNYKAGIQPSHWELPHRRDIVSSWYQIPVEIRHRYVQVWCFEVLRRVAIDDARWIFWEQLELAAKDFKPQQTKDFFRFCRFHWHTITHERDYVESDELRGRQRELALRRYGLSAIVSREWTGWHWSIDPDVIDPQIVDPYWEEVKDEWDSRNKRAEKDKAEGKPHANPLPDPEGTEYVSYFFKVNFGTPRLQLRISCEMPKIGMVETIPTNEPGFIEDSLPKEEKRPRREEPSNDTDNSYTSVYKSDDSYASHNPTHGASG